MDSGTQLENLEKAHEFFIGLDSDGCVFDTMEIKHKECFCPAFIKHFKLQAASRFAREVWQFVNLYSETRGCNRFLTLQRCLQFVNRRPEFAKRGIGAMAFPSLDRWIREEDKLGNPALKAKVADSDDPELKALLAWSLEVNERIADMVYGIPPFPGVRDVLESAREKADLIVVSQTPMEALTREWAANRIDQYVAGIAGQEYGTKVDHLAKAAVGKYSPERILMVGDAPGDLDAARSCQALFFPIIPGDEENSWQQFADEGLERFFTGTFAGDYQTRLLTAFEEALPEHPPWQLN